MSDNEKLKKFGRNKLYSLFANGNKPDEKNFKSLIDSFVNKVDDGFTKTDEDGLIISPSKEKEDKLISFYKKVEDENAQWAMSLDEDDTKKGFHFQEIDEEGNAQSRIYLGKNNTLGINNSDPISALDVKGIAALESRIGTRKMGLVPADGEWHVILDGLTGVNGYELMAQVGKTGSGRHALLHATMLSAFGNSRSKIRKTRARYARFKWWDRLCVRWRGTTYNYRIEVKTGSNYGDDIRIKYAISALWDDHISDLFNHDQ